MTTSTLEIDGVSPRERISPRTAEDLAAALKAADDTGQAVAAVGGGTQLDLGMPPLRLDVVVDTTGLDRVVEYEPADLTVTVEAGMRMAELSGFWASRASSSRWTRPRPRARRLAG